MRSRACRQHTFDQLDALAHANQPVSCAHELMACQSTRAVVANLQLKRVRRERNGHRRARRPSVLDRVGQRLLHHPEREQLDRRRQPTLLPHDLQLDGKSGRLRPLGQAPELIEARCPGSDQIRVTAPKHTNHPSQLLEGVPPRRLYRSQRSGRSSGITTGDLAGRHGLDHHHAEAVRQHIVDLPRDSGPLLSGGHPSPHLLLTTSVLDVGLKIAGLLSSHRYDTSRQVREDDHQQARHADVDRAAPNESPIAARAHSSTPSARRLADGLLPNEKMHRTTIIACATCWAPESVIETTRAGPDRNHDAGNGRSAPEYDSRRAGYGDGDRWQGVPAAAQE